MINILNESTESAISVLLKTKLFHLYNTASGINVILLLIRVIIKPQFSHYTKCCLQYNRFNSTVHLGTGYDIKLEP